MLALIIASAFPDITTAQEQDYPEYVVKSGESLYSIAQTFGASVDALRAVNDINDPSLIVVGQRIMIPSFEGITGELATRPLLAGDTLDSLARMLDADTMALVRLNRIVNPRALFLGQPIIYQASKNENNSSANSKGERLIIASVSDTLVSLAAQLGCSIGELAMRNALLFSGNVYPGRQLFVPTSTATTGLPEPLTGLHIIPDHPSQGEPMLVIVDIEDQTLLSGNIGNDRLHFINADNKSFALHGVHAMSDPGTYTLVIQAEMPEGEFAAFETRVAISNANYRYQAIMLPEEKWGLLSDSEEGEAEERHIQNLALNITVDKLWNTSFSHPLAPERITATFGLRRSYNGGPYDTFHSGVDFGAPEGTPVVASSAGTVVLSEKLKIRGNATVIDHGWGVYTTYWHLSERLVSVGDTVASGETIGSVGNSGLSTGSHLHWEVWVGGNPIDPIAWIESDVGKYLDR